MPDNESPQLVTVSFGAKVSTGNYENEDLRVSITQAYPVSFDAENLLVESEELANSLKAQVYKLGGIESDGTDDGMSVRRLSGGVSRRNAGGSSEPAAEASRQPTKTPRRSSGAPVAEKGSSALWRALMSADDAGRKAKFWDNRIDLISGKSSPKAPPFKTKAQSRDEQEALWVSDIPDEFSDLQAEFAKSPADSYASIPAFG